MDYFNLKGKTAVVTGGAGLLGKQWVSILREAGAEIKVIDLIYGQDVTSDTWQRNFNWSDVDILVNNACRDPTVGNLGKEWDLETWIEDLNVGLTGAFLCCKYCGRAMEKRSGGVIVNIGSDMSNIAPDQRIYGDEKKPLSYSVIKHGIVGLTRWAATYWAGKIRVNCLSIGGVYNWQPQEFVDKVSNLIPMGRMARIDEYKPALLFMVSNASSYMTGANVIIDGGRSIW